MRFAVPSEIALSATTNTAAHGVQLKIERVGGGEVTCRYKSRAGHPSDRALIVSCSRGVHAGDVVRAEQIELEVDDDTVATARVILTETAPCGPDASTDASTGGDTGTTIDAGGDGSGTTTDASTCSAASCDTHNACSIGQCTPAGCTITPAPAGTACSLGRCTVGDTCNGSGSCIAGALVPVNDGNPCTVGSCDPVLGVVHAPVPAGTSCSDGNACNGLETCNAVGVCQPGTPLVCHSNNSCMTDGCAPATGCTQTPKPAGTPCPDGNLCNGNETCSAAGACVAGTPPVCQSNNACIVDSCVPATGCAQTPIPKCDPTPVQGDAPFETRASITGKLVAGPGGAIAGASFTVYDERAIGAPRGDVAVTTSSNGGFRLRLSSFPETEPVRSPPHRLIVAIDTPTTIRAYREVYAHPGESVDLGSIRLVRRDPRITNIGPAGGTATDSLGRIEIVVPPGALTTTLPIQITPFAERDEFPAPLPAATLTMYGFEAEPSGTQFAVPVTVRAANYRNLPTTLTIPIGSFDSVEGRWQHEGIATWNGSRFSGTITHFSPFDMNSSETSDRLLLISKSANANKSAGQCGVGSSWQMGGGSIAQAFSLPGTRTRNEDLTVSLHYDSGLAASRKIEPAGGPVTPKPAGPASHGSLAVTIPGVTVKSFCVSRGGGAPSATQPGECVVAGGSCGNGGVSMLGTISMLANELTVLRQTAANSKEAAFGGWLELPLGDSGELPSTGFVSQTVTLTNSYAAGSASACASGGGGAVFGVADPLAPRTKVGAEQGPSLQATRKVLIHHRFTSPYGAGWGIREVSRLFTTGDYGVLVGGNGQEEEFRPRARVAAYPGGRSEQAFARDQVTGELFVVSDPGTISKIDVVTGARTPIVTGLAFPPAFPSGGYHALAVAYVGSARHFVVALASRLVDVSADGSLRILAPRGGSWDGSNGVFAQSSVAARGSVVFYTAGDPATPVLYRFDLAEAAPVAEVVSASKGDVRLDPRAALAGVQFGQPLGLAFGPDGVLYVADARRHVVYRVVPSVSGAISAASAVTVALGDGAGRQLLGPGEALPGRTFSLNQPLVLAMAEDGKLLVVTSYGVTSFDPVAREAELLFLHGASDEVAPSLAASSVPASIVALTSTALLSRTYNAGIVRVDVDLLSSETDPTRTIAALGDGSHELVDTMAGTVWRYEPSGRLVEQRKRTGETDFTVSYTDTRSDAIDHITNAVGGTWRFAYASGKLASITDPAGGRTQVNVSAQGDLTSFVEPDGEAHMFTYDTHHMATKTTSRGDVTSYTFAPDGTVATSTKPGGETYAFETVPTVSATYSPSGSLARTGAYTDARGVRHVVELNVFGDLDKETYTADGVTRVVAAVHPEVLDTLFDGVSLRQNLMLRTSQYTVNGVALSAPVQFDALGRMVSQGRSGGHAFRSWRYAADGWLAESLEGPAGVSQHYQRDAAGHVTRISDGSIAVGDAPTGREMTFTWRADGQPATMTAHGVTTTFAYDDAGGTKNLLTATDTLGRALKLGYDARGNVTSTSDGTASSSFLFDANNRLTETRDAFGNATTLRYTHATCGCSEGDLVTGVHTPDLPAGVEWAMTYGAQGRLASVTDPHGFTESYTYETTGEVASIKDRLNRTTTMAHDQLGRLLSLVDRLGRRHDRSYTVPAAGTWSGPTLSAASANGTASTTSLSGSLRSGDYQIGVNAYDTEGFPAQISLYRDATFALGYTSYFDDAQRMTYRADRAGQAIDSALVPTSGALGSFSQELISYDGRTSAPLPRIVEAPRSGGFESSQFSRNVEYDLLSAAGFGGGIESPATYAYTRDVAGRVVSETHRFSTSSLTADPTAPQVTAMPFSTNYSYRSDGRVGHIENADGGNVGCNVGPGSASVCGFGPGAHDFTYDARGQLATQTDFDGTYQYSYDGVGRNTRLTFPDGHTRVQVFDDLGRITSRCYEYTDPSLNRCYGAQYDSVGNPVRLSDPEGADVFEYDALDRLTKATRLDSAGLTVSVESYAFNGLGALSVKASLPVDDRRPRLDGVGTADAAVPATLGAKPVTLDAGGRITSLRGVELSWARVGQLRRVSPPVPNAPVHFGFDAFGRRAWTLGPAKVDASSAAELYLYQGVHRIAALEKSVGFEQGAPAMTFAYDGVDHPLRVTGVHSSTAKVTNDVTAWKAVPFTLAYYEVDLAGSVRRARARGGLDLGGYRYSAFGETLEDTVASVPANLVDGVPLFKADLRTQPLRWKGMWRYQIGATELYDARARLWSPALGTFLSVDEYWAHDPDSTLWGWPGQNPVRWRDPTGHCSACWGAIVGGIGGGLYYAFTAPTSQSWGDFVVGAGGAIALGAATGAATTANPLIGLGVFAAAATQVQSSDDFPGHLRLALATGGLKGLPSITSPVAATEGVISGGAGSCDKATKAGLASNPIARMVQGPLDRRPHFAQQDGNIVTDPTIRGNLKAYGQPYEDIPVDKVEFSREEWDQLVQRLPKNPGEQGGNQ